MKALDFSSSAHESSMDHASDCHRSRSVQTLAKPLSTPSGDADAGGSGGEILVSFGNSFSQVQSLLDRNRILIHQVNQNHQSRVSDNLVKNVGLIQELNGNISKIVSLYSDLSSSFCTSVGRLRSQAGAAAHVKDQETGEDAD